VSGPLPHTFPNCHIEPGVRQCFTPVKRTPQTFVIRRAHKQWAKQIDVAGNAFTDRGWQNGVD